MKNLKFAITRFRGRWLVAAYLAGRLIASDVCDSSAEARELVARIRSAS